MEPAAARGKTPTAEARHPGKWAPPSASYRIPTLDLVTTVHLGATALLVTTEDVHGVAQAPDPALRVHTELHWVSLCPEGLSRPGCPCSLLGCEQSSPCGMAPLLCALSLPASPRPDKPL
ncbi:Hypothetical predicted protein [Marmota monax]|uniref:Uncharacterized protein n=1 Tax=Marmota monax TaxID=9995 RepID=A0A5E4AX76_MARMO|nr:Hypothetical predicted protein [Marmota monax]